jgi:hypothetical protein
VTRVVHCALVVVSAGLALAATGCGSSRPAGVAVEPGDCYAELSDMVAEKSGEELRLRVHYKFPDGFPDTNSYFCCVFEVNGGSSGTTRITKKGSELDDEGEIMCVTNSSFNRQKYGSFSAQIMQSKSSKGPWHAVSGKCVMDF